MSNLLIRNRFEMLRVRNNENNTISKNNLYSWRRCGSFAVAKMPVGKSQSDRSYFWKLRRLFCGKYPHRIRYSHAQFWPSAISMFWHLKSFVVFGKPTGNRHYIGWRFRLPGRRSILGRTCSHPFSSLYSTWTFEYDRFSRLAVKERIVQKSVLKLFRLISVTLIAPSFMFAPLLAQASTTMPDQNGIFTQLCATGRLVFIPLSGKEDRPEPPLHKMIGCHAVCSDRQVKVKRSGR